MILKETLSYYIHHNSFVYCIFLDAMKAFMIRYDTIESLTWTRKLSIQLNLTHV